MPTLKARHTKKEEKGNFTSCPPTCLVFSGRYTTYRLSFISPLTSCITRTSPASHSPSSLPCRQPPGCPQVPGSSSPLTSPPCKAEIRDQVLPQP